MRHPAALDAFLRREAAGAAPLTQREFTHRFGATRDQVASVVDWARSRGLTTRYISPDGLVISLAGPATGVVRAFGVRMAMFRGPHGRYMAPLRRAVLPAGLPIQSVIGLDSRFHGYLSDTVHDDDRSPYGYLPADLRRAYGLAGHGANARGQHIAVLLWGTSPAVSDYVQFAKSEYVPRLTPCRTSAHCDRPNTIRVIQMGGASTDTSAVGEATMDTEWAYALAPGARLSLILAHSYSQPALIAAISLAAGDPSIHLVSNSWGGLEPPGGDGFEQAATNEFKHAAAVGTTFLFASGDSGFVSSTTKPVFPTASPWVASVGGTTLQMDSHFHRRVSETVWNSIGTLVGPSTNGGGSGCASGPLFRRQSWEHGWTGATCRGRAYPDFSADADPLNSPAEYILDGVPTTTGGTSFAAPIWTGLLADTDRFLQARHHALVGFVPMAVGRLVWNSRTHTVSPLASRVFYDVRCGYNGATTAPGWDEATGWGSPNWFALTEALAAGRVAATPDSQCSHVTNWRRLWLPWNRWPQGTQASGAWGHPVSRKWRASTRNPFRAIRANQSNPRSEGALVQRAQLVGLGDELSATEVRMVTYFSGPRMAARYAHELARDVGHGASTLYCSNLTPLCRQFRLSFADGTVGIYTISSVANLVDETLVVAKRADYPAVQGLAVSTIDHDLTVTDDPLPAP
jgi:subtilase family serine protease